MGKKLRIAVIFGGRSGEHEVSLVSAKSVMGALDSQKYEVIPIGITKEGAWLTGKDALLALKTGTTKNLAEVAPKPCTGHPGLVLKPKNQPERFLPVDAAFPLIHGTFGEDGCLQGFLELADIPYVGCDVLASALGMDKFAAKMVFQAADLPQVKFLRFLRSEIRKNGFDGPQRIAANLGFPCFVKPANLGSSVGISKVKSPRELMKALLIAAEFSASVLVEEGIDAREIECAVLGNEEPLASVAGEVVPSGEFYDYRAKYVDNASQLIIPAKLSSKKMAEVQSLAVRAFQALQGSGMARVDFFLERKTNRIVLNEVNTIPGFTPISMYPKLWEASGLPYTALIDRLIELARERHQDRAQNKTSFESGSEWYKE